jgi:hypothetical protein
MWNSAGFGRHRQRRLSLSQLVEAFQLFNRFASVIRQIYENDFETHFGFCRPIISLFLLHHPRKSTLSFCGNNQNLKRKRRPVI